jgi:hypothetical protein
MEAISHNGFSVDLQLKDAVKFVAAEFPALYDEFLRSFPEWERVIFPDQSAWIDWEEMGVDVEWSSWAVDWIEQNTPIYWEEGEPWID